MSIQSIMAKKGSYQTAFEVSTPIYILEADLEDALDGMDEAVAEMEDLVTTTNLIEMEDAHYDAEGFFDSIKNGIKMFADKVKSAIDKVITMIQDYITKVLDKMDTKWLEKNQEFIEKNGECKNVSVKMKNWTWNVKTADENTTEVEAMTTAVDNILDMKLEGNTEDKIKAQVVAIQKTLSTSTKAGSDAEITKAMIDDAKDKWFEDDYKKGSKSKEVKLSALKVTEMLKVWNGYREERKAYKDMIKELTTLKKNIGDFKVDAGETDADKTLSKLLAKNISTVKTMVGAGITVARDSYKFSGERRREITNAFKRVISEVKKKEAKEKRDNK